VIEFNEVKKKGFIRKRKRIEEMSIDEVYEWFLNIALPIPAKSILTKKIDGIKFNSYEYDDFYQLGVPSTGFKFKQFDITFRELKHQGFYGNKTSILWDYTVEDFAKFFESIVLNEIAETVRSQKIDGKMSLSFIFQDFYNIGVPVGGFKEKQFRIEFEILKRRPILRIPDPLTSIPSLPKVQLPTTATATKTTTPPPTTTATTVER
jgi:hypothetical protein